LGKGFIIWMKRKYILNPFSNIINMKIVSVMFGNEVFEFD
jgi:hypothetical protein